MGTNFWYRFAECGHCDRYTEIHVCKSRHTWRAYPHRLMNPARPDWGYDRESPTGMPIITLAGWRNMFTERPGRLFDEYGKQVDDPLAWLDEAVPWRPTPEGIEQLREDQRAGLGWVDANGFRFYAEEFS